MITNSGLILKRRQSWWMMTFSYLAQFSLLLISFIQLETNFLQRMPQRTHLAISFGSKTSPHYAAARPWNRKAFAATNGLASNSTHLSWILLVNVCQKTINTFLFRFGGAWLLKEKRLIFHFDAVCLLSAWLRTCSSSFRSDSSRQLQKEYSRA